MIPLWTVGSCLVFTPSSLVISQSAVHNDSLNRDGYHTEDARNTLE